MEWQDVTPQRQKEITYTNNTDHIVYVFIRDKNGMVSLRGFYPNCQYNYNGEFIKWFECREKLVADVLNL